MNIPFFVEAAENRIQPNLQVCHWIMGALFKHRIQPLPLATTPMETEQSLASLAKNKIKPAVFVINSYLAEDLMTAIDPLIGDTPAVIMRRESSSGFYMPRKKEILETTVLLQRRQGRETALCPYSATNSHYVADCVAQCLLKFLADKDFWHFAPLSALATSALRP